MTPERAGAVPGALSMVRTGLAGIFVAFDRKIQGDLDLVGGPERDSVKLATVRTTRRASCCQKFRLSLLMEYILVVLFIKSDNVGPKFLELRIPPLEPALESLGVSLTNLIMSQNCST